MWGKAGCRQATVSKPNGAPFLPSHHLQLCGGAAEEWRGCNQVNTSKCKEALKWAHRKARKSLRMT